jgi:NADPH-dependent 2,4-dienoyl-CoA reductase/sulfur reductase-like enzyme/predicted acylesterase/phospholipase RssA
MVKYTSSKSRTVDYLLVGGGLAGAAAAETLRREEATGSVLLMCSEATPPYYRPPLSKQFLLGQGAEDAPLVHTPNFYEDHGIELALGTRVTAINAEERTITTAAGLQIGYGKLLIATGSVPKRCAAPGAELPGVHYLRTVTDCQAIRNAASPGMDAVVLGGSFLGMEIAMSLAELGLKVTVIEYGDAVLPHLEAPVLSDYFRAHALKRGVTILTNDTVAAFHGGDRVEEIETVSGLRMPCRLAVVSIGVSPATEFLQGSAVLLEGGRIAVDEFLRTNDPNIYAAGDVVSFYDPIIAKRRHIEHLDNAIKQGQLAAKNMLGRRQPYNEVSYFFCQIGDLGFNVLGATEEATEWIRRGSLVDSSFAMFYFKDDVLRALFSLGRPVDETRQAEGLIRYRVNLRDAKLAVNDPEGALGHIPNQTVLILQGGGALGAFECGVVKGMEEADIFPDVVAGVSIGAVNGAIVAANPRNATQALEAFWTDLEVPTPCFPMLEFRHAAATARILSFGIPQFFRPRWIPPFDGLNDAPWNWNSYYDASALKGLISKYVDFAALKASPVRLLVGAVNVMTGELEVFDSHVDELTPDHILASGSLPPGFPWTMINGAAYWDGGIVSNSPLDIVIDRCGPDGKHVFIVDLFSGESPLPSNMIEIMARRDEIVYSERVRSDLRTREIVDAYRRLVDGILSQVSPADSKRIKHWPTYIQLMGNGAPMNITRIVRRRSATDSPSRDYDFSDVSIRANVSDGYALAKRILAPSDPQPNVFGRFGR